MPDAASSGISGRPVSLLIAALGGEGGGVLTNWIVEAATAADYPVQSTSIPGVAQRTGATTYYLEIHPEPHDTLAGREPVMTLTPGPGDIDLMVASEILEAGRALENGFISPDRTTLIASTHRIYAVAEKSAMADGRFDASVIIEAAQQLSQNAILLDFSALARDSGSIVNAVLAGAIAATGKLPFEARFLEDAIRQSGIAVEANLEGFRRGHEQAEIATAKAEIAEERTTPGSAARAQGVAALEELQATLAKNLPDCPIEVPEAGLLKVIDFQDADYGRLYVERLTRLVHAPGNGQAQSDLLISSARGLANWMAFDDVVRVADLKTRAERFRRVRSEVRAGTDDPMHIVDYFKPGLEEVCAILPSLLARPILSWAERTGRLDRWHLGLYIRTTSIPGYALLRTLANMRRLRRLGYRYKREQRDIEAWLEVLIETKARDLGLAFEIAECARLIRGYGETHRRGQGNFDRIVNEIVRPGLATPTSAGIGDLALGVRSAREAALADPEGRALDAAIQLAAE